MRSPKYPWSAEYRVLGIPETLRPYPDKPVYDILYRTAKKYKNNGLVQNHFKITYRQLAQEVDRLATVLQRMGLKKGDRVATLLPTSIQFFVADYAISRAGLVQIPSSPLEPPANLKHKFEQGTPRALICMDEYLDVAKAVMKSSSIEKLLVTTIDDYSNNPPARRPDLGGANQFWMKDLIDRTPADPPDYEYNVEKDLETLLFTGGTTGLPKGCMLTHRNIYANALQNLHAMGQSGQLIAGAVSVLLGLPLFHSYGHMIMHAMTLFGYNQIMINDPRDTAGMVKMIKDYRPLIQIGVPTQFMKLCYAELKGAGMLGLSGSAPLPPNTQQEYEKVSKGGIMEGYGLSEMSPVTHLNGTFLVRLFGGRIPVTINSFFLGIPGVKPVLNKMLRLAGPKIVGYVTTRLFSLLTVVTSWGNKPGKKKPGTEKRGTIGIPFPDTEIKIVDAMGAPLSWDEVAAGIRGEMLLSGPQRMLGYWPTPGNGIDEEGFIHTSDIVRLDERGYFYIVDRTKDMIIVSGYKVYSREIDDLLAEHPGVEIGATVGIPDPEREGSEIVVVYVQPRPNFQTKITSEEIIKYLRERAARYAIPKRVIVVDAMPLTEVQKVDKKLLRKMAIDRILKEVQPEKACV